MATIAPPTQHDWRALYAVPVSIAVIDGELYPLELRADTAAASRGARVGCLACGEPLSIRPSTTCPGGTP